jgi:dTDP-4-amino-4,6-dideoxygalactose transaminase
MGPKTFEFEKAFMKYVGAPDAIAVSTGTAALYLTLEATEVCAGDEVLLPTTTFTATAEPVMYLRARPVLVDIDPDTLNLDPEDAAHRTTPRAKAIIPVHLSGQPRDMDELRTHEASSAPFILSHCICSLIISARMAIGSAISRTSSSSITPIFRYAFFPA